MSSPLIWSKTPPAKDGFYWFRFDGEVTICEVSHDEEAPADAPPEDLFLVEFLGDEEAYFVSDYDAEWAGPIEQP